ncbi:MAG: rhomboid family intramembrane serine protease [Muribaculaceae bacterium]
MDIIKEISSRYRRGSLLVRLIFINIGVFLVVKLAVFVLTLLGLTPAVVSGMVELPSEWLAVAHKPWTLLTYMFMHGDLMHIFFNMLCFYWFGLIFMEFNTPKQMVALYVLSGLGGALAYLSAHSLLPAFAGVHGSLVGASASVLGVIVAVGLQAPNYRLNLLFLGPVALKWVVLPILLLDVVGFDGSNLGGHIAHLGGALVGLIYALALKQGRDITGAINRLIDSIVGMFSRKKSSKPKASKARYHYSADDTRGNVRSDVRKQFVSEKEERIDAILEKIKQSGYTSLSKEEKELLFSVGKNK